MSDAAYDPLDTIRWMLTEARQELTTETAVDPDGKTRRKTKARRHDDEVRFETLCSVIWNVTGRRESLDEIRERTLA